MNWLNCQNCSLSLSRRRVVLGRGPLPADILFLGEAPGKSEETLGIPFCGPSGRILERGIAWANPERLRIHISNMVACRPPDNRSPTAKEIDACSRRVEELVLRCSPHTVVLLGTTAHQYHRALQTQSHFSDPMLVLKLFHPAFILRKGGVESPEYFNFRQELKEAFRETEKRIQFRERVHNRRRRHTFSSLRLVHLSAKIKVPIRRVEKERRAEEEPQVRKYVPPAT